MADENHSCNCGKMRWIAIIAIIIALLGFGYHYMRSRGEIVDVPRLANNEAGNGQITVEEFHVEDRLEAVPEGEEIDEPGKQAAQEGIKLYIEKKYEEAKEFLEKAAAEGNADAKALLGKMYVLGQGVVEDVKKGLDYLEDAAERGSSYAMAELGKFYVEGKHGVEKATDKGLEFIKKSIDTGGYYGHLAMARLYELGEGVEHSTEKAVEYLEEAGKKGYKFALEEIEKIKAKF